MFFCKGLYFFGVHAKISKMQMFEYANSVKEALQLRNFTYSRVPRVILTQIRMMDKGDTILGQYSTQLGNVSLQDGFVYMNQRVKTKHKIYGRVEYHVEGFSVIHIVVNMISPR